MDTTMAMARLSGAVEHQLLVTGGDPTSNRRPVLLSALEPAVRPAGL
jgi:hypothetical protein